MSDINSYFDAIDLARVRRIRELSEIKRKFSDDQNGDPAGVNPKAVAVLTYANWEGFYNECVREYVRFLIDGGKKVCDVDWMLLVGTINSDFEALRAKNHSVDAKHQFVAHLRERLECGFDSFDCTSIEARSNLDFKRLSQNYRVLSFDLTPVQRFRIRLDKELVAWRHSVAHGDSPDLSNLDIASHVDFVADLLVVIADTFQQAIVDRA
jgi:hypothetical protein